MTSPCSTELWSPALRAWICTRSHIDMCIYIYIYIHIYIYIYIYIYISEVRGS